MCARERGAIPVKRGKHGRHRRLLAVTALATGCLALSSFAQAADINWTGTTSNDWFDASNWDSGVPTSSQVGSVDTTTPNAAVISGAAATAVAVRAGKSSTGTITI